MSLVAIAFLNRFELLANLSQTTRITHIIYGIFYNKYIKTIGQILYREALKA